MKKSLSFIIVLFIVTACSSSKKMGKVNIPKNSNIEQELVAGNMFRIKIYTDDSTYGYTEENPIKVGMNGGNGPLNERRFLNALTGPNGETVSYSRLGSCCRFPTSNAIIGNHGLLDKYEIVYDGQSDEIVLYINMYDSDTLRVPQGFRLIYDYQIDNE